MERGDKKGLSSVVTTLIIILISLVAIGIVWVVVSNIISEGSEEVGIEKFSIDVNFLSASINGDNVTMTVKRASGAGNLSGLKFIITDGLNSEDFTVIQSLVELQEKTFTVTLESLDSAEIESATVAPVYISSSGKETIGLPTDTYSFGSGSSGGTGGTGGTGGDDGGGGGDDGGGEILCVPECIGDDTCINGICVPPGCAEPRGDAQICTDEGAECGEVLDICGEFINCDIAVGGCNAIEQCVDNLCVPLISISGTVDSVWPSGVAIYFDSADLPLDTVYSGYYAKFLPPSEESECLLIEDYQLPQAPQTKVMIKLQATQTSIGAGDSTELWPSFDSCMA